jgi:hypothetical protein
VETAAAGRVLLEREHDLELLREMLRQAEAGSGALAFIEAPAGQGKTALLRALRREATGAGVRVLSAIGAELERDFAFGVVRQLFEPELHVADEARRARLFRDAAELARPVVVAGGIAEAVTDASHARLHGLFWLLSNLAEEQPALIVVDDAHWGDAPSLRFLDMLTRRVEDVPVLLAIAARPNEPGAETQLLDSLASAPTGQLVRPGTLSRAAVGQLVRARLGEAVADAFVGACYETTGGNPLLLTELLGALEREGATGVAADLEHVRRAVPATISRTVVARLRRLAPAALALARGRAVRGSQPADEGRGAGRDHPRAGVGAARRAGSRGASGAGGPALRASAAAHRRPCRSCRRRAVPVAPSRRATAGRRWRPRRGDRRPPAARGTGGRAVGRPGAHGRRPASSLRGCPRRGAPAPGTRARRAGG